jgi:hypothetical protein
MAERVVTDTVGLAGDSGGLLRDHRRHSDAFGIYMGAIPSVVAGPPDALAQGAWQVSKWFDADLWS